jgi:hypothetical protein
MSEFDVWRFKSGLRGSLQGDATKTQSQAGSPDSHYDML